jgi:hypothetical protein
MINSELNFEVATLQWALCFVLEMAVFFLSNLKWYLPPTTTTWRIPHLNESNRNIGMYPKYVLDKA